MILTLVILFASGFGLLFANYRVWWIATGLSIIFECFLNYFTTHLTEHLILKLVMPVIFLAAAWIYVKRKKPSNIGAILTRESKLHKSARLFFGAVFLIAFLASITAITTVALQAEYEDAHDTRPNELLATMAENGDTKAQLDLAARYMRGRHGEEQNKPLGYMWLYIATKSGDQQAISMVNRMEKWRKNNEDLGNIQKGRDMADEWMEKHKH